MNRVDRRVRAAVYACLIETGTADVASIATAVDLSSRDASAALRRLHEQRRVVLSPDGLRLVMAHPFSGVDTGYTATIGDRTWRANCGWDAFAILAMLGDGTVEAVSPLDGASRRWTATDGLVHGEGLIHFLVPARHFWDDIGFT